jgi:hypothetical protein
VSGFFSLMYRESAWIIFQCSFESLSHRLQFASRHFEYHAFSAWCIEKVRWVKDAIADLVEQCFLLNKQKKKVRFASYNQF